MKQEMTHWYIEVPKVLDEALEKAVEVGTYGTTKSKLVRIAVQEKLASMGHKLEPFKEK